MCKEYLNKKSCKMKKYVYIYEKKRDEKTRKAETKMMRSEKMLKFYTVQTKQSAIIYPVTHSFIHSCIIIISFIL